MTFAAGLQQALQLRQSDVVSELERGDTLQDVLGKHLVTVEAMSDDEILTSVLLLSVNGKLLGSAANVWSGGKSAGKSGATTCHRCSGLGKPFKRCSPRSRKVMSVGTAPLSRTNARVASDNKICPPYATDITRAARLTVEL